MSTTDKATATENLPSLTLAQKIGAAAVAVPALAQFLNAFGIVHLSDAQVSSLTAALIALGAVAVALFGADFGIRAARNKRVAAVTVAETHAVNNIAVAEIHATPGTVVNNTGGGLSNQTVTSIDDALLAREEPVSADDEEEPNDVLAEFDLPDEDDVEDQGTRAFPDVPEGDEVTS